MFVVLPLGLLASPPGLADPLVTEQSTVTLSDAFGLPFTLDREVDWPINEDLTLEGDFLYGASIGVQVPARWTASYDPDTLRGARYARVIVKASTLSDPPQPTYDLVAGLEAGLSLDYRGFSVGEGVDFGVDASSAARAPMAGERLEVSDTIDTGLAIRFVAAVKLAIGSRLEDGELQVFAVSASGATVDACPGTDGTTNFTSPDDGLCLGLTIDDLAQQGDVVTLRFDDLRYAAFGSVPLGVDVEVVGASVARLPVGAIPLAFGELARHPGPVMFELPVVGTAPDLIASHLTGSTPLTQLWPLSSYPIHGFVINNDADDSVPSAATVAAWWIREVGTDVEIPLGTTSFGALGPRERRYGHVTLDATQFAPGDYEVGLRIDADDELVEVDEANNEVTAPLTILDIPPDLAPVADSLAIAPPSRRADAAYTVTIDVQNDPDSTLASGPFEVELEVLEPALGDAATWTSLGRLPMASLAPGGRATASVTVPAPATRSAPGTRIVRATVDPEGALTEWRIGNNRAFGSFRVDAAGPDLWAEPGDLYFYEPGSTVEPPGPSDNVLVFFYLRNGGSTDASDVPVRFSRVKGSGAEETRIALGSETVFRIDSGEAEFVAIAFVPEQADPDDPQGLWTIEADIGASPGETALDNNVVRRTLHVGANTGHVEVVVRDAQSGALLDGVQLSVADLQTESTATALDDALDPEANARIPDIEAGTHTLSAHKMGFEPVAWPVTIEPGYTTSRLVELDLLPGPDLVGDVVPVGPVPVPGSVVDVRVRIRNQGGLSVADGFKVALHADWDDIGPPLQVDDPDDGQLDPGEEIELSWPSPIFLPPNQDTVVGVVVDPDDRVAESFEGNNAWDTILTNAKPEVTLESVPVEPVGEGRAVRLVATAVDPDGDIHEVSWRSSRDGELGTVADLTVAGLSVGAHRVTFTATDDRLESTTESANVVVVDATAPVLTIVDRPALTLTAPAVAHFRWDAHDNVASSDQLQFATQLLGADADRSAWTVRREQLWLDLDVGEYTLRLVVRDAAGNETERA
ncbi:MAG: carboxypeptidase-like regulatory domain-containing protein, partial [Myxococcota bacterium]